MVPVDWDLQRPNMNAKALEIDFISQNKSHHVQANISFMYTLNYMQTQMIKWSSSGHKAQRKMLFLHKNSISTWNLNQSIHEIWLVYI